MSSQKEESPRDPGDLVARKDQVTAEFGPWMVSNIRLGEGVHTKRDDWIGVGEFLVHAVTQAVSDLASKPLEHLRILDLACGEGGFSIELGLHGASVLGIEGRAANVEKARFAAEELGLDRVTFQLGDVRDWREEEIGRFDVVLCLGILYHLEAADAVHLIQRCHEVCDDILVIRSAVGLNPNVGITVNGTTYQGRKYGEDVRQNFASLKNATSFLPTRASLLNLLSDTGFTSVYEVRNPVVPEIDVLRDSVTLAAIRGRRAPYRSIPELDGVVSEMRWPERRGPSWLRSAALPEQGLYWRIRERLFHTVHKVIFESSRPIDAWRRHGR
jgi:SAM-dependent methyltransferase